MSFFFQVYRKCYGQHVGFSMFMDNILLSLARKVNTINRIYNIALTALLENVSLNTVTDTKLHSGPGSRIMLFPLLFGHMDMRFTSSAQGICGQPCCTDSRHFFFYSLFDGHCHEDHEKLTYAIICDRLF